MVNVGAVRELMEKYKREFVDSEFIRFLVENTEVRTVAIKCWRKDCKFRDERGYCTLSYVEINERGECIEYEPRERDGRG